MNTLKKSEVVTFVAEKVVEHFSQFDTIPSKLEIQRYISSFVDDYKVDTGKWDTKGDKPQKILKDLSDYYTKMSVNEIKASLEEIIKNQAKIKYPEIHEEMDIVKLLKELKKTCWNIKAEDILSFFRELLEFALYARTGTTIHPENKDFKYMRGIYLKSEMEGCGKSTILNKIEEAAEKAGLKVADASWPLGRFGDMTQYSKNNIAILDDTDAQVLRNINETKLKTILRHGNVDNELKGLDAVSVKANAAVIAAGNVEPPKASDRCWRIFDIIPASIENYLLFTDWGVKLTNELTTADLSQLFNVFNVFNVFAKVAKIEEKLKAVKKGDPVEKDEDRVYKRCRYLNQILEILKLMKDGPYDFHRISIKEIVDFSLETPNHLDAWKVTSTFKILYGNDVISKDPIKASTEYQKYDLKGLELREPGKVSSESDESTSVKEEIEKNQQRWDLLIREFESFSNDNPPKKEVTDEEFPFKADKESKLDDSWTVCNRFDKEGEYDKEGDQACVNKPLEGECKNRCDSRVHKQNYLFECDNIPIEEQCKMIWNLPESFRKCILWACKTGGKSIHTVVATNTPDYASSKMRQYIHSRINDMIFDGKADPSTFNAGRIARAPNATRQDKKHPKAHQTCYLFNMNAEKLDVSKFVKEYEEIEEEDKFFYRFKEMNNQAYERKGEGVHTLEELKKWNEKHPSKAKQEAIDLLEGNLKDWNRALAAVRSLKNFGFDEYEIETEAPYNDKWVRGALKKVFGK